MIRRTFLQSMAAMLSVVKALPQAPEPPVVTKQIDTSVERIGGACCIDGVMLDIRLDDCELIGGSWSNAPQLGADDIRRLADDVSRDRSV